MSPKVVSDDVIAIGGVDVSHLTTGWEIISHVGELRQLRLTLLIAGADDPGFTVNGKTIEEMLS